MKIMKFRIIFIHLINIFISILSKAIILHKNNFKINLKNMKTF